MPKIVDVSKILPHLGQGLTDAQVASLAGCSGTTVKKYRRLRGIAPKVRRYTQTDVDTMERMAREGKSREEIAAAVGKTASQVSHRLVELFPGGEYNPRGLARISNVLRCRELLERGYNVKQIAARLKRCEESVYKYLKTIRAMDDEVKVRKSKGRYRKGKSV